MSILVRRSFTAFGGSCSPDSVDKCTSGPRNLTSVTRPFHQTVSPREGVWSGQETITWPDPPSQPMIREVICWGWIGSGAETRTVFLKRHNSYSAFLPATLAPPPLCNSPSPSFTLCSFSLPYPLFPYPSLPTILTRHHLHPFLPGNVESQEWADVECCQQHSAPFDAFWMVKITPQS